MSGRARLFSAVGHMSTGAKTFILMSVALFPLGLIALFASLDAAGSARQERIDEAQLITQLSARRLSASIEYSAISLRVASTALDPDSDSPVQCREILASLTSIERAEVELALFTRAGELACSTENYSGARRLEAPAGPETRVMLDPRTGAIRVLVNASNRETFGLAILPETAVISRTRPIEPIANYQFALQQGDTHVIVHRWPRAVPARPFQSTQNLVDGQIQFETAFEVAPLGNSEKLAIILPLLMWFAGALLGWFAVKRLILRPLADLQSAVARFHTDNGDFIAPVSHSPAAEIRELGASFHSVVSDLRDNERAMASALEEQARLTREVHHRVKNNLQIVASLLNLHARSAINQDTALAYASIKRRVDALAIVQRNLLGEQAADRGLPLRPIVAELVSALQLGSPEGVRASMSVEIGDVRVAQEIAVAVCFYMTELIELAFTTGQNVDVAIRLEQIDDSHAMLSLQSEALAGARELPFFPRYQRVIDGLARQLRAPVERSEDQTQYTTNIPTI